MTDTTERPPPPAPPSDAQRSGPDDAAATREWTPVRFAWLRPQAVVGSIVLGAVLLILSIVSAFRNKPGQIGVVMRQDAVFQEDISGTSKSAVLNLPEGLVVK